MQKYGLINSILHCDKSKVLVFLVHLAASCILGFFTWLCIVNCTFKPTSSLCSVNSDEVGNSAGAIHHIELKHLIILRDSLGLYCLSDVCTHLGCVLQVSGNSFDCGCHGSRFDLQGRILRGPASKPLDSYYIYRDSQNRLIIDPSRIVDPDFRCKTDK